MSIAVPTVALAMSLSGQVGRFWSNYQCGPVGNSDKQNESTDKCDKRDEKPAKKSNSGHGSSSHNKPGNSDRHSSITTSKGIGDTRSKAAEMGCGVGSLVQASDELLHSAALWPVAAGHAVLQEV